MEKKMKILIAADMEGISGVVNWDQVNPDHPEYTRFREIMTEDVSAAVRGAFQGGADEVQVSDGHNKASNILVEKLDTRARLNSGSPSPLAMVTGVDQDVDGIIFIGYHAKAGTINAVLAHTWSGSVAGVWINQCSVGEIGINTAVAGHFNVPLLMISGDQSACQEAEELVPGVGKVVVKQASGRMAANCLTPKIAQAQIESSAEKAVNKLKASQAPSPYKIETPVNLEVEFFKANMADQASVMPGTQRDSSRRISFQTPDALLMYYAFRTMVGLAR
jgi:D-amino peptidase